MKRLLPYLLLNVIVSATTVLIVLLIWNGTHSSKTEPPVFTSSPTLTSAPTATLPPLNKELFEVQNIIGGGDVASEYVHILYLGSAPLDLQGWQVLSGSRTVFTFPAFLLYKNGGFDLHTKAGTNTAIDLFIGQDASLWKSGASIRINDIQGNERLNYIIP